MTTVREMDVITGGRDAGLVDVKVARFSETLTALKFVIPLAERSAAGASTGGGAGRPPVKALPAALTSKPARRAK